MVFLANLCMDGEWEWWWFRMERLVVGAEKNLEAISVTTGTAASSYPGIAFSHFQILYFGTSLEKWQWFSALDVY